MPLFPDIHTVGTANYEELAQAQAADVALEQRNDLVGSIVQLAARRSPLAAAPTPSRGRCWSRPRSPSCASARALSSPTWASAG